MERKVVMSRFDSEIDYILAQSRSSFNKTSSAATSLSQVSDKNDSNVSAMLKSAAEVSRAVATDVSVNDILNFLRACDER